MLLAALSLWTAIRWAGSTSAPRSPTPSSPAGAPTSSSPPASSSRSLLVAWLIGRLNRLYIGVTGTNQLAPMRPTWLKSMRDTAPRAGGTTVVEAVLMGSVLLAGATLTVWFFLLAG